jgi:NAD+ synthase
MTAPLDRALQLDAEAEIARIGGAIRAQLGMLRRRGAVVAVSGGIDSSVVAALCARAVGAERVVVLSLPERESAAETPALSRAVAAALGVECVERDITPMLEAAGCYAARDAAIGALLPEYGAGWRAKIVLPDPAAEGWRRFLLVARAPDGRELRRPLPHDAYLAIVAATNCKQRTRKMLEYHEADRRNYAVAGTPNRLEYDQGFFVRLGDGAADLKPIAHLYKSQVYALGRALGLPEAVVARAPTTDTYPLPQGQDEFYFSLSYAQLDLCLWGVDHGVPAAEVARQLGLDASVVAAAYADIAQKRRTTAPLHWPALLVEPVPIEPPPAT